MGRAWRTRVAMVLASALAAAPSAAQQWAPGGVPVCQNGCPGDAQQVVGDGLGGAFIGWRDSRNNQDIYLQHLTASGTIASSWPVDGLPIVLLPSIQQFSGLAPDGLGGALVAWEDRRYVPGTAPDAFAQRVLSSGSLPPSWVLNGNPASLAPREQRLPQIAPDGEGGAFLAWEDYRDSQTTGSHIYGQHMTALGSIAPGWPSGGLPICTVTGAQIDPFLFPDDSGGMVVAWVDSRGGAFAQRMGPDGSIAAGWVVNGIPVEFGQPLRWAMRDEAGGF